MLNHHNWDFNGLVPNVPLAVGDRFYSQDQAREFWYSKDRLGQAFQDFNLNNLPSIISGGVVTKGTGNTLNITVCVGWARHQVTVPLSFAALPPTTQTQNVEAIRVVSTAQVDLATASRNTDDATTNFVKLQYDETNGNSRARAKKAGSYNYERIASFKFVIDDVTPTNSDIVLANFVTTGGGNIPAVISKSQRSKLLKETGPRLQNVLSITTQTEFERFFGKSFGDTAAEWYVANVAGESFAGVKIPANTKLVGSLISGTVGDSLASPADGKGDDGTNTWDGNPAYVLKNAIELSDNVTMVGFGNIIKDDSDNTNEDNLRFFNTFKEQQTVGTPSTNVFNGVPTGTNYNAGDLVHWSRDNSFYTVVSSTASTVTVDRDITDTGGTGVLSTLVENVRMEDWTFDGRGGVDGLGGDINAQDKLGGAFQIPFIGNSIFDLKIINQRSDQVSSGRGAVFADDNSVFITARNIFHCETAGGLGGAAFGLQNSNLRAYFCEALGGGAFFRCNFSTKLEAYNCQAINGGGADDCDNSVIFAYNCKASGVGGGAINCDFSTIKAYDCTAVVDGDIANGCLNCESIWGNTGNIAVNCKLGGVRLVGDDIAGGDTYTDTPRNKGGYTNATT